VPTSALSDPLQRVSARVRARLNELSDQLSRASVSAGIAPAVEWAQSAQEVFLSVKFSHKLDAPATLGCVAEAPLFEANSLTFRAECAEKRKVRPRGVWRYAED
jgi:hypothetical protein